MLKPLRIILPELLPWCTSRVTAMTRIKGRPLAEALRDSGIDKRERRRIVEKLVDGLIARPFWMSETWAIFHGDPHGGNLFFDEQGRIVPLDWSLAVELPKNDRVAILQLLLGGLRMDEKAIVQALSQLGLSSDDRKLAGTGTWGLGSNGTENSVKDYSSPSRSLNGRSSPRFIASGTAKE